MSNFAFDRSYLTTLLCLFFVSCAVLPSAIADEPLEPDVQQVGGDETVNQANVQFSFEGVAWREVIRWIADEAGLALQFSELPTGSFTYSDPRVYSHQDAIERINLFLLPQGFTLVRSGQLLSVINLSDPRSMQQLDALAELVKVEQLAERNNHDVVKCIFPLGDLAAEDAVAELEALNLMTTPSVFTKTNQIMVTDTAGKLKNAKQILDSFQPNEMDNGTIVQSFALKYVDAEDVLVVARPHLGLATGEMIGIDVSLSADLQGKNIFVTGVEDKVKLIERLVMAIDRPDNSGTITDGEEMELRSHLVEGGNVETVYDVLQTLLAGKSVRLSVDESAGSVVALATPSVQTEIAATVTQLQASDADFEVIPLKTVDPYFAISLLEGMLDLPDEFADPEDIDPDAPKIDADPAGRRLFVRAKKHQIEQIKKIVAGLDETTTVAGGGNDEIRIFPLTGKHAEGILETAAKFWRGDNPVILYRSYIEDEPAATERVAGQPGEDRVSGDTTLTSRRVDEDLGEQRILTVGSEGKAPAIRCQLTSRGVLLQSDDPGALDQFEDHLRTIAGPGQSVASEPVVFYLQYSRSHDALRMLAELLDGGVTANESQTTSLVNGYVSSSSSDLYLGSLVTARDGTVTMMAGTMTVVADPRLNRLIAQGTTEDIARIERYLNIIDKDTSITEIATYGKSHVIELENTRASEVAVAIRDAFAGRVSASSAATAARGGKPSQSGQRPEVAQQQKGEDAKQEKSEGNNKKQPQRASASQPASTQEPKMTVAVHEPSNSLIVTAPDALFEEVEKLARAIDARGQQSIEVITPINGELMELVLQQVLLGESETGGRPPASSSRSSTSNAARSRNDR